MKFFFFCFIVNIFALTIEQFVALDENNNIADDKTKACKYFACIDNKKRRFALVYCKELAQKIFDDVDKASAIIGEDYFVINTFGFIFTNSKRVVYYQFSNKAQMYFCKLLRFLHLQCIVNSICWWKIWRVPKFVKQKAQLLEIEEEKAQLLKIEEQKESPFNCEFFNTILFPNQLLEKFRKWYCEALTNYKDNCVAIAVLTMEQDEQDEQDERRKLFVSKECKAIQNHRLLLLLQAKEESFLAKYKLFFYQECYNFYLEHYDSCYNLALDEFMKIMKWSNRETMMRCLKIQDLHVILRNAYECNEISVIEYANIIFINAKLCAMQRQVYEIYSEFMYSEFMKQFNAEKVSRQNLSK